MTNQNSGKFTRDSCQRTKAIGMKRKQSVLLKRSGLDAEQIEQTLRKGEPRKRVSRDQAEFPVSETPTLIINGEVVGGTLEYGELKTFIDARLRAKSR